MGKREREWEVIRLRAKGEFLGRVRASDEKAAMKAALNLFPGTTIEEAKRLLVRERSRD